MHPVEAIDIDRHTGFLVREHQPVGKVSPALEFRIPSRAGCC
jgi:hypothetical protein